MARSARSALGVLRSLAGLLETGLLALGNASVPGEEACLLQRRSVELGVDAVERAGHTEADRAGLARGATAVDPDEPLTSKRNPGRSRGANFWRRFSISAGITTTGRQIENARNVTGLIGSQLPLVGLGFRLFRLVRVSGGVALYNLKNVNPVVDKRHLSVAPYVALSLDLALFNWAKNLIQ